MRFKHVDLQNPRETTILIEGLQRELVLAQITDTHAVLVDERDSDFTDVAIEFEARHRKLTPGGVASREVFGQLMAKARAAGADCVMLTGDITQMPSRAAIDMIATEVEGLNYLYAIGNHDWHFPGLEPSEATRQLYTPRFNGLTGGNPAFQSRDVGGVRLIALDNCMYQVTATQVDFLREQLASGIPCLLFIHIPIVIDSLQPDVMKQWRSPIMMGAVDGWTDEARINWRVGDVEPSTREALDLIRQARNLAGIFCGHVHFTHADWVSEGCVQYVTDWGLGGGYRMVRLKPLG